MRVLVTGGTGFIGRTLTPYLLESGHDVALLVREAYGMGTPLPEPLGQLRQSCQLVYADLRNFRLTVRALRESQPDAVIHLAAAGVTDPFLAVETALRHNVSGTVNLLRACFEKTTTVQRVIIGRTPGELSAMNVYATSKLAAWNFAEMYTRTAGWPITGAMVFQAYGPGQAERALVPSAIRAALAGQDFPMTAGTQRRDWIFVDDVAAGIGRMLTADLAPGATVDLGTGIATPVADVVRLIYELTQSAGKPLIGALPDRPGEAALQSADVARTTTRLDWNATIALYDGLQRLVRLFRPKS
ncbi:MAG: NAD-dependent epimerase/dehydratase family protein [Anaerolineae bacterium]|nr:NAD-dependent epimerase/dehydratase family protein [Anaerolineae bacterium]